MHLSHALASCYQDRARLEVLGTQDLQTCGVDRLAPTIKHGFGICTAPYEQTA